jgi:phosphatidate cytidylyltransferase
MLKREIAGLILAPALLATILLLPAWCILAVIVLGVILAADELLGMARGAGIAASRLLPLLLVAATMVAAWWFGRDGLVVALLTGAILIPAFQLTHPRRPEGALAGTAVALLAVLHLGATGACLGWLRLLPEAPLGPYLLLFFFVTIWIGDSGAYYVGKNLGRHRMSPRISPKKTWEGLLGGAATTFAAAAVMKIWFLDLGWLDTMALAAILAVVGPIGDLVESQFKRDTGVKDSSGLIPGHGGLLDRTDSVLFAAPPALGYLALAGLLP